MEQIESYLFILCLIVLMGQLFLTSSIPIALIILTAGLFTSFFPFPPVSLNPRLVLDIFLPLLIYESSAFSSWRDIKKNMWPIALLSIGHVIFITVLVAVCVHALIPGLGWPLSFILGAAISPPDDVAIFSISKNIRLPERVFAILEGEALFNDATALIFFRFSLAALMAYEFSAFQVGTDFIMILIGETVYGFLLGNLLGQLRKKLSNPIIHTMASLLTPFIAYLPVVKLGGSGVIATAIVGFIIGNQYAVHFTPEFRLISRGIWPTIAFALQGILFFLVGLNIKSFIHGIISLPLFVIGCYVSLVIVLVIIGRFIWNFLIVNLLQRLIFLFLNKRGVYPPWQDLFLISWAGMRGSISLAIVLSVPFLPVMQNGVNPRDLIIFLVCSVVIATLVLQGLTLPWIIKKIGVHKQGQQEKYNEHLAELSARIKMTKSALRWLIAYKIEIKNESEILDETKVYIKQYKILLNQLKERLSSHDSNILTHNEDTETSKGTYILLQIIEVERKELLKLWQAEKINLITRNKLMAKLDHQIQNLKS